MKKTNANKVEWLSKDVQKAMMVNYEKCMESVWTLRNGKIDTKMVDYCKKKTAVLVPLNDGKMISLEKSGLEKDFYFGYSVCGQGPTYDDHNETMRNVSKYLEKYFVEKNKERIEHDIQFLKDKNHDGYRLFKRKHYISEPEDGCVVSINYVRSWEISGMSDEKIKELHGEELTHDELNNLILGYKELLEIKEKQISSYLKRYGTSKLSINSYWIDD